MKTRKAKRGGCVSKMELLFNAQHQSNELSSPGKKSKGRREPGGERRVGPMKTTVGKIGGGFEKRGGGGRKKNRGTTA